MKINVRGITLKRLRDNALYFFAVGATTFILVLIGLFFLYRIGLTSNKITLLEQELAELRKKKEFIDYKGKIIQDDIDIQSLTKIFRTLVPAEEDVFSIALAIEQLSVKSGFTIFSYSISPAGLPKGKLSFVIQGQGNLETFIGFLKEYQFSGGRLITVSDAKYSSVPFPSGEITLSIYSGKPANRPITREFTEEEKNLLRKIIEKVSLEIKPKPVSNTDYPVKSNPF